MAEIPGQMTLPFDNAEVVYVTPTEDAYRRGYEDALADVRAKVSAKWVSGYDPDQVERIVGEDILALIEDAAQ